MEGGVHGVLGKSAQSHVEMESREKQECARLLHLPMMARTVADSLFV